MENGEFVPPEKPVMMSRRSEIENGEIAGERWKKGEAERISKYQLQEIYITVYRYNW